MGWKGKGKRGKGGWAACEGEKGEGEGEGSKGGMLKEGDVTPLMVTGRNHSDQRVTGKRTKGEC